MAVKDEREIEGRKRPHWVYKTYDTDGALLYIGCTRNPESRFYAWFNEAKRGNCSWPHDAVKIVWQRYADYSTAVAAEKAAIETERPIYNVQHRPLRSVA